MSPKKFFYCLAKHLRNDTVQRRGLGHARFSIQTARNRLRAAGMKSRKARRKPELKQMHRDARLLWAQQHRRWTQAQWRNCLFTDESRFSLVNDDQTRRVWRRRGENAYEDRFLNRRELFGGGGILVWGGITHDAKTELMIIQGNLNGMRYTNEILDGPVRLFAGAMGQNDMIFVDDNARPHRNHIANQYVDENSINRMEWPAKSPDLNPIENVWGLMKRRISRRLTNEHTLNDLRAMVLEEWERIPLQTIRRCISSMRRRAEAVIAADGGHTRY